MCFKKYFCCFSRARKEKLLPNDVEKYRRRKSNEYEYDDNFYDVMENWKFFRSNSSLPSLSHSPSQTMDNVC